jgi:hypothetical protein
MPPFVYPHLNIIAILSAAAAQFILGFLWYSPMTPIGRRWMAEAHMGSEPGRPGKEMAVFPASAILAAWAVAMVIGWSGASGPLQGVCAAWTVGTAVAAQAVAGMVASNTRSTRLAVINVGYLAVGYGLMGGLIGILH